MIILSGDIGGTNTRLQLAEFSPTGEIKVIVRSQYLNKDFTSFIDIMAAFFEKAQVKPEELLGVCFGVAGPIIDNKIRLTNLPWVIDAFEIKAKFGLGVELINDFFAIGYGIETLEAQSIDILQKGELKSNDVKAFIGAGTGLGVGFMIYNQGNYVVHASEGGHVDFAPSDDLQMDLWRFLKKKYHHVSCERVLSGPGLINIYNFLCSSRAIAEKENSELRNLIDNPAGIDLASAISEYAILYEDAIARRALEVFLSIYGAIVGNLALTFLPFGGIYIASGIALKLLSQIKKDHFLAMFNDKGRMSKLMNKIPLYVVLDVDVGLRGAAVYLYKKIKYQPPKKINV